MTGFAASSLLRTVAAVAAGSGVFRGEELRKLLFCLVPALIFFLLALWYWHKARLLGRRCRKLAEADRSRRGRLAGMEALAQSMAELARIRCFLTAPDDCEVLFEAGEEGAWLGRFQVPEEYARNLVPEDREHFLELWRRLLAGETDRIDLHCHAGGNGSPALFAERAEVLTLPGCGRRLLTVVSADLSALEQRGRELAEADRMLRMIFDNLPIPVFTRDANGDLAYLSCNPAFAALFGVTPEEIPGKSDAELLRNPELALKIRLGELELARSGGSLEHDWTTPARGGAVRVFRFREYRIERADGTLLILGIGRELPRRREQAVGEPEEEEPREK